MLNSEQADDEVEWSVEVELEPGDNELTVEVEGADGNVTDEAANVSVKLTDVPSSFALDSTAGRLVGFSLTLTPDGLRQRLVEHDLGTGEQSVHPGVNAVPALACLRTQSNRLHYLQVGASGDWRLHEYDLTTRQSPTPVNVPTSAFDPPPGSEGPAQVQRLVCSDADPRAFALLSFRGEDGHGNDGNTGFAAERVVAIEPASMSASTLTETDPTAQPRWRATDIEMAGDALLSQWWPGDAPLTRIDLSDGTREPLAPGVNIGGHAFAPDLPGRVFVASLDGVEVLALDEPPEATWLSQDTEDEPLRFDQLRSLAHDPVGDRLLVGDEGLDGVVSVNVATGERSEFLFRRVGEGPIMIAPRVLALTADGAIAYVVDDGGNAYERLYEVAMDTGDRNPIGDIVQQGNHLAAGVALDEAGQRVFVAFPDRVLEVDLVSEAVQVVVAPELPGYGLVAISGLLFDAQHERLLLADAALDLIVAVELSSGQQSIVSRDGERGEGAPLRTPASIGFAESADALYAVNQESDELMLIDLATGDREVVVTGCALPQGEQTMSLVRYNPEGHELLIESDGLYSIALATGVCRLVPVPAGLSMLDIQPGEGNRLYAAVFNALVQLDRLTGQLAIVAK